MIRNLTPHVVAVLTPDGRIRCELPTDPAGPVRTGQTTLSTGVTAVIGDNPDVVVALGVTRFGAPEGLPEPIPGTWLVVSLPVIQAAAAAGREIQDLLLPAEPVRDDTGRIIGCHHLATVDFTSALVTRGTA